MRTLAMRYGEVMIFVFSVRGGDAHKKDSEKSRPLFLTNFGVFTIHTSHSTPHVCPHRASVNEKGVLQ